MTKEEKQKIISEIGAILKDRPNIYLADAGGLTVAEVNQLRRMCFDRGVHMRVVKNTLLRKALEQSGNNYEGIFPALRNQSSVFFINENFSVPAKIIRDFRGNKDRPVFKGAYVDSAVFVGADSLATLANLKSKKELIGDIIALLQSPMKNVIGALNSGKHLLSGVLKTLGDRPE